jgi:hypothetical protein
MSFADNLQYKTENFSLYFQGGVRRSLIIFAGICLVMLVPTYFLGQQISNLWSQVSINPNHFNSKNIVIPKNLDQQPLDIGTTQVVKLANGQNTLYLTVNNKANPQVGYFPFVYTLQILTANGQILSQKKYQNYLLPGDIKYVVADSADPTGVDMKLIVEPETQAISYNPNQVGISKSPNIVIKGQSVTNLPNSTDLQVDALFKNQDQVDVDSVDVLYIIRDARESVVGIGTYTFNGFLNGTEREMNLNYPQPADRSATQADVRWSVNYLDPSIIKLP